MNEHMAAEVEVWPVAADESGIWLLSGQDAWHPWTPIPADSDPHGEVELILASHGALDSTRGDALDLLASRAPATDPYLHRGHRGGGSSLDPLAGSPPDRTGPA